MKKKRFVKLLMARGIQRNEANAAARLIGGYWGSSYAELFEATRRNRTVFGIDIANTPDQTGVRRDDALVAFAYAVRDLFSPVAEAIQKAFAPFVYAMSHEEHATRHTAPDGYRAGAVFFDELDERGGNDE